MRKDTYRAWRWAAGVLAAAAWIAVLYFAVRGSHRPVVGRHSLASLSALLVGSAAGVGLTWLALAADRTWRRLAAVQRLWSRAPVGDVKTSAFAGCLGLALACQASFHVRYYAANQAAVEDQGDYLRVAAEVKEKYGPVDFVYTGLWKGDFHEANRHPLYVALLAVTPSFSWGKLLSIAFALLLTCVSTLAAGRLYGSTAGCWTAALLSTNGALLYQGSLVACESLLAVLVLTAWALLSKPSDVVPFFKTGLWLGLAYLTKASAFFILLAAGLATATQWRWNATNRLRWILLLALGCILCSLPLLVRNVRVYGSPLYSFNNRLMFADDYDSGVEQEDLGFRGNLLRYWRAHTVMQMTQRFVGGVFTQAFVVCRTLGPVPLDSGRAVIGAALLLLSLAVCLADGNQTGSRTLLAAGVFLLLFFGWYSPIATSDRFWCPLLGPLAATAAAGLGRCIALIAPGRRDVKDPQPALRPAVAPMLWIGGWTAIGHVWLDAAALFPN